MINETRAALKEALDTIYGVTGYVKRPTAPKAGDLALISQSGAVAAGLAEWASTRGIGFSAMVSIGDAVDIDFGDLLDYFALDRETRAILLYVESIREPRKFMRANA